MLVEIIYDNIDIKNNIMVGSITGNVFHPRA